MLDWLESPKWFCLHLPGKYPKPKYIWIACQFWITNCIVQFYLFYKLRPWNLLFPWAKEGCQATNSYFTTHKGMGIPQAFLPVCLRFLNFYWLWRLYQGVQLRVLNYILFLHKNRKKNLNGTARLKSGVSGWGKLNTANTRRERKVKGLKVTKPSYPETRQDYCLFILK